MTHAGARAHARRARVVFLRGAERCFVTRAFARARAASARKVASFATSAFGTFASMGNRAVPLRFTSTGASSFSNAAAVGAVIG